MGGEKNQGTFSFLKDNKTTEPCPPNQRLSATPGQAATFPVLPSLHITPGLDPPPPERALALYSYLLENPHVSTRKTSRILTGKPFFRWALLLGLDILRQKIYPQPSSIFWVGAILLSMRPMKPPTPPPQCSAHLVRPFGSGGPRPLRFCPLSTLDPDGNTGALPSLVVGSSLRHVLILLPPLLILQSPLAPPRAG